MARKTQKCARRAVAQKYLRQRKTAVSRFPHIAGDGARSIENKEEIGKSAARSPQRARSATAKNNVQTNT